MDLFIAGVLVGVVIIVVVAVVIIAARRLLRDLGNPVVERFEVTPTLLCGTNSCALHIGWEVTGLGRDNSVHLFMTTGIVDDSTGSSGRRHLSELPVGSLSLPVDSINFPGGAGQYFIELVDDGARIQTGIFVRLLELDGRFSDNGLVDITDNTPQNERAVVSHVTSFVSEAIQFDVDTTRQDVTVFGVCKVAQLEEIRFLGGSASIQESQPSGGSREVSIDAVEVLLNNTTEGILQRGEATQLPTPVLLDGGLQVESRIRPPDELGREFPPDSTIVWTLEFRITCGDAPPDE